MAKRIKIKTERDNKVHFDLMTNDYTLCGLETAGDEGINIAKGKPVKVKVNCADCIRIVEYCQLIERKEWK